MTVMTNKGDFADFYSVWRFMQEENLENIEIRKVVFWAGAASIDVVGSFTLDQIYHVFTDDIVL